ncbi:MAG: alkaline phosphatase family protein, partial [Acetobacteraceae bacterium]
MTVNFDHLVVLMLENRSFDHMLGRLYHPDNPPPYNQPPNGQSFDGVVDGMSNPFIISNPFAPPVEFSVSRIPSPDYAAPQDNSVGHQFPDVQMQLYGMPGQPGSMQGFVNNRLIQFKVPHVVTQAELQAVMAGFSPTTTTADGNGPYAACTTLSTLASAFAVCDNWYSSMPGPTFCNRSFLHAGTSNGWTSNNNDWTLNDNPTIFNALLALQGPSGAKIYHGNGTTYPGYKSLPCLTYYIHPTIPIPIDDKNTIQQFCADAANGALASYSFIEPEIIGCDDGIPPNDQHPARDIRYGENLINTVYQAVRGGPLWERTLLVVTYDEHGGFFDHRVPPAVAAPNPADPPGEDGFKFTSLGLRVPAVLISPWIAAGTVFHPTQAVDHTAVIRTLCNRWNLPPLTQRDANAIDFSTVLGTTLRPLSDTPVPSFWNPPPVASDADVMLNDLQIDFLALVANRHRLKRPPLLTQADARRFLKTLPAE